MTEQDQWKIEAARTAHGQWLTRLRNAIEYGTSEFAPATVRTDDRCDFGKWLHGDFPAALRRESIFEEIRAAHARFHALAAEILALALAGKKVQAMEAMEPRGEFMRLSGALVLKLAALKRM